MANKQEQEKTTELDKRIFKSVKNSFRKISAFFVVHYVNSEHTATVEVTFYCFKAIPKLCDIFASHNRKRRKRLV